uniref:Vitellogenin n=1 Tax=Romanomermis culicivorax TaxID=13658 RepID=A0A915JBR5_ROMCU
NDYENDNFDDEIDHSYNQHWGGNYGDYEHNDDQHTHDNHKNDSYEYYPSQRDDHKRCETDLQCYDQMCPAYADKGDCQESYLDCREYHPDDTTSVQRYPCQSPFVFASRHQMCIEKKECERMMKKMKTTGHRKLVGAGTFKLSLLADATSRVITVNEDRRPSDDSMTSGVLLRIDDEPPSTWLLLLVPSNAKAVNEVVGLLSAETLLADLDGRRFDDVVKRVDGDSLIAD